MNRLRTMMTIVSVFLIALLLVGCGAGNQAEQTAEQDADPSGGTLDTSDVQEEQDDLNTDELNDIDDGLSEIENI